MANADASVLLPGFVDAAAATLTVEAYIHYNKQQNISKVTRFDVTDRLLRADQRAPHPFADHLRYNPDTHTSQFGRNNANGFQKAQLWGHIGLDDRERAAFRVATTAFELNLMAMGNATQADYTRVPAQPVPNSMQRLASLVYHLQQADITTHNAVAATWEELYNAPNSLLTQTHQDRLFYAKFQEIRGRPGFAQHETTAARAAQPVFPFACTTALWSKPLSMPYTFTAKPAGGNDIEFQGGTFEFLAHTYDAADTLSLVEAFWATDQATQLLRPDVLVVTGWDVSPVTPKQLSTLAKAFNFVKPEAATIPGYDEATFTATIGELCELLAIDGDLLCRANMSACYHGTHIGNFFRRRFPGHNMLSKAEMYVRWANSSAEATFIHQRIAPILNQIVFPTAKAGKTKLERTQATQRYERTVGQIRHRYYHVLVKVLMKQMQMAQISPRLYTLLAYETRFETGPVRMHEINRELNAHAQLQPILQCMYDVAKFIGEKYRAHEGRPSMMKRVLESASYAIHCQKHPAECNNMAPDRQTFLDRVHDETFCDLQPTRCSKSGKPRKNYTRTDIDHAVLVEHHKNVGASVSGNSGWGGGTVKGLRRHRDVQKPRKWGAQRFRAYGFEHAAEELTASLSDLSV